MLLMVVVSELVKVAMSVVVMVIVSIAGGA